MRRVLRGSEKRLKKLSWGSKLQAALTSSTYLREKQVSGERHRDQSSPQGLAQAPPLKAFPCCPGSYFHLLLLFLGVTCLDPDYLTGEIKGGPGNQSTRETSWS